MSVPGKNTQLTKKEIRNRKIRVAIYIVAAILAVVGVILYARGVSKAYIVVGVAFWLALLTYIVGIEQKRKYEDARNARLGMIKLPSVASEYHDQDYRAIASAYKRLGFRNVVTINLHDLRHVMLKKPGTTECVTVGGKKAGINEWYDPDAEVKITYHGFAEEE